MSPRLIGFYSYKGGVGRSMALAHCAVELARRGRKVLIIDLDLEAPGQHCTNLFRNQFDTVAELDTMPKPGSGFIDFTRAYSRRMDHGLPELQDFLALSTVELGTDSEVAAGQIFLLPAGNVRDTNVYRKSMTDFAWSTILNEGGGFGVLRHLRGECQRLNFYDVLIDSRTGDADPFYVVALELADVLVMVSGYNRQNLLGTQSQLDLLQQYPPGRQPSRVILVGSPKPSDMGGDYWVTRIKPVAPRLPSWDIELPYQVRLALSEDLLNLEVNTRDEYSHAILRLIEAIDDPEPRRAALAPASLINPFSVIRADYASNQDLIKFFVDPGQAVTRALSDFMPVMVYGNRGTGKTTLAKHHSFETHVDQLGRPAKAEDLPPRIGLYLRFDIDLLNVFNVRDEALRDEFNRLFANFLDILVIRKALAALHAFGGISSWCDERRVFTQLLLEFNEEAPRPEHLNLEGFQDYLERHLSKVRRYLNNPGDISAPVKVQGNILMKLLVEALLADSRHGFGDRWFAVMVDEVEHFQGYQQRVLNSRIKQIKQNDRVTYRYFLRHEGLRTKSTVADESQIIQESHDFRTLKLDEGLSKEHFAKHVREIAIRQLELQPQLGPIGLGVGQRELDDLFAKLSPEQEAQSLVDRERRKDELRQWLLKHKPNVDPRFLSWFDNEPAVLRRVVGVILLNQGKPADEVAACFEQWNKRASDWYHNYHRAGLFWLCGLYRVDKTYAGLDQILLLSGQNVRYFLEYCRAIVDEWIASAGDGSNDGPLELPISVRVQDRAIRARSQFHIDDLRGKPRLAEQMLNLVRRLGAVFKEAHKSPRQSQPEMNHFSIIDYDPERQTVLESCLRECRMENVLLRRPGNKQKSLSDTRFDDWVLHPCFAPYFDISPRHKKKLDGLRSQDLNILFSGSETEFGQMLSRFRNQFKSDVNVAEGSSDQTTLFDD